jgi:hypothetical protein
MSRGRSSIQGGMVRHALPALLAVGCANAPAPVSPPLVDSEDAGRAAVAVPATSSAPATVTASPAATPPEAPGAMTFDKLPAIADDGSMVAVAHEGGGQGQELLLLDLIQVATDQTAHRVIVDDPSHPDSRTGAEAKARRLLGDQRWLSLTQYATEQDPKAPLRKGGVGEAFRNNRSSGEGLTIEYREPVLVVRDATAGREILRRSETAWSGRVGEPCIGCVMCPAPLANDGAVWGDRSRRVLLVRIDYQVGSDTCPEPPATFHIVQLPAAASAPDGGA